jgi:hypothetical protein
MSSLFEEDEESSIKHNDDDENNNKSDHDENDDESNKNSQISDKDENDNDDNNNASDDDGNEVVNEDQNIDLKSVLSDANNDDVYDRDDDEDEEEGSKDDNENTKSKVSNTKKRPEFQKIKIDKSEEYWIKIEHKSDIPEEFLKQNPTNTVYFIIIHIIYSSKKSYFCVEEFYLDRKLSNSTSALGKKYKDNTINRYIVELNNTVYRVVPFDAIKELVSNSKKLKFKSELQVFLKRFNSGSSERLDIYRESHYESLKENDIPMHVLTYTSYSTTSPSSKKADKKTTKEKDSEKSKKVTNNDQESNSDKGNKASNKVLNTKRNNEQDDSNDNHTNDQISTKSNGNTGHVQKKIKTQNGVSNIVVDNSNSNNNSKLELITNYITELQKIKSTQEQMYDKVHEIQRSVNDILFELNKETRQINDVLASVKDIIKNIN